MQRPTGVFLLEPDNGRAENAAITQVRTHPRFHGAQVLTDNERAVTVSLQQQNANHRFMVVVHVSTFGSCRAVRDPPEAEQTQNMVDADCSRKGHSGPHDISERCIAGLLQCAWVPRRLSPVLALLRVHVRWGSHPHRRGELILIRPELGSESGNTNRQVSHDSDGHSQTLRHLIGFAALLYSNPLGPLVELDALSQLNLKFLSARRVRGSDLSGKFRCAVVFRQCTPEGVTAQVQAALFNEAIKLCLPVQ